MIRPFTLLCAVCAAGSGLGLYQVKHRAEVIYGQIRHIQDTTAALREHIGVLKTQYTLLNEPDRLQELASQHLPGLKTTQPGQWTNMAELDRRLPPVGQGMAPAAPLEPEPKASHEAPAPAMSERTVAPTAANSSSERVAAMAPPKPAPHPAPVVAATAVPRQSAPPSASWQPSSEPAPVQAVAAPRSVAARAPVVAPTPLSPPRTQSYTEIALANARAAGRGPSYLAAHSASATTSRVTRSETSEPTVPVVASSLGMARAITQPVSLSGEPSATLYTVGNSR